jgi:hypothetical protein
MSQTTIDRIKDLLGDLAFPADKDTIIEHARRRGADPLSARALSALAIAEYANLAEVVEAVPAGPEPERSESERDYQRRHHRKAGLAEHMRQTRRPPVEEELGENRRGGER